MLRYIAIHSQLHCFVERLDSGRVIGNQAVEGWAKTMCYRLKRRYARWNRTNVQPIASLVIVRHTKQWNAYWEFTPSEHPPKNLDIRRYV